ncbi:DUF424 family protein, partial [Candidatus Heimdallarchaeota archaeon]
KTISEGERELYVNEKFFGGELVGLQKCIKMLKVATSANIIGKDIIEAAIDQRIINKLTVMWIQCPEHGRVGHALLIR